MLISPDAVSVPSAACLAATAITIAFAVCEAAAATAAELARTKVLVASLLLSSRYYCRGLI